jgi:hypothetical protein
MIHQICQTYILYMNTRTRDILYKLYLHNIFAKHVNVFIILGNTMVISDSSILFMVPQIQWYLKTLVSRSYHVQIGPNYLICADVVTQMLPLSFVHRLGDQYKSEL